MRADRIVAVAALALAAAACERLEAPAPVPRAVEPERAFVANRTAVVIRGEGFVARTAQSASGGAPQVDVSHRAWLGAAPLEDVRWIDPHTLSATVPAGLPPGRLPLVVENAYGLRGRLDAAFEVVAERGAALAVAVEASAAVVTVGQEVAVTVRVANVGWATAREVEPALAVSASGGAAVSLGDPSPGSAGELAPGEAVEFAWSGVAAASGELSLTASALGVDAFSGDAVAGPAASAGLLIERPASLVATISAARARATTGQAVAVALTVSNGGSAGAVLTDVAPSSSPPGGASCTPPSPAPPLELPAGDSVVLAWSCTSALPGGMALSAAVAGADTRSGAALAAAPDVPAAVAVESPPELAAAVALAPGIAEASVGQPLALTLTVSNTGGAPAVLEAIVPGASPPSGVVCGAPAPPPPLTVSGGASVVLGWTCTPALAGGVSFGADVAGRDGNSGAPVAATAASTAALPVVPPAALAAAVSARPSVASVGQPVAVTLTVTNGGTATARLSSVGPSASGTAAATCGAVSPPLPASIPGGQALALSWTCTPSTAGALALSGAAAGTDANSGALLSATPPAAAAVTVQAGAAVSAAAFTAAPSRASAGQAIALSLTLSNAGAAAANVTAVTPAVSPTSAATCTAPAPAVPQALPGGASRTFTWSCTAAGPGTVALGVSATAADANSGAIVAIAPAPRDVTVDAPAALVATAFTAGAAAANVGQPVAVSLTLANGGEATAVLGAVLPSFSPAVAGTCSAASPAPPVAVPGGASATFTWTCSGSGAGEASLGVALAATDANSGAPAPAAVAPLSLTVVRPAALAAAPLEVAPTLATVGQPVSVSLTLTNPGGADAVVSTVTGSVAPPAGACGAASPAGPVTIGPGEGRTFAWTCTASAAGAITLGAAVSARDGNSGAPVAPAIPGVAATVLAPAALEAAVAVDGSPAAVLAGTPVGITLTLRNPGGVGATVTAVTPTSSGGAAACSPAAPGVPASVAAGAAATFTWTCTPGAPGLLTLGATVAGADAVSGAPLAAAPTTALAVQSPAALSATLAAGRTVASTGQPVPVTLSVTNTGGGSATLTGVAPASSGAASSCGTPTPALPGTLPAGQSAAFTWACTAAEPGAMTLGAAVAGADALGGGVLAASAEPVGVTVQAAAALAVTAFAASRTVANVGQRIDLSMTVRNTGGASARVAAVVATMDPAQGGTCTAASPAPPQTLAGGATLGFTWSCTPGTAGPAQLGASVAATDVNSGASAGVAATPIPVTVQTPASLSPAALTATPTTALVGQAIAVGLTLVNAGGATANVTAVTPAATPPAGVTCTAPSPAPPQAIAGGQARSFAWTCTATQQRSPTLRATVQAADASSGAALTATVTGVGVAWVAVLPLALAAADPSAAPAAPEGAIVLVSADAVGDGSPTGRIVALGGQVLVGPDASGGALARHDPSGGGVERVPLAVAVDAGVTPAANGAWLASAPATTLGIPGCAAGTRACGPDDEAGLVALAAGTVAGAERLALAAAGAGRYVYVAAASPSPLEAAFVDLRAVQPAAAPAGADVLASAVLDRLLLAADGGAAGPRVLAVAPPAGGQGADAVAGQDVIDLGAAASAGPGAPTLAEVAGAVYVAARGGLAWTGAGLGWRDGTPSAPPWSARAPAAGAARTRAVPALAAFGACPGGPCVFAARTVAGGSGQPPEAPQLWRCAPTAGPGGCAPGDWALVAPDPADPFVSRLGAPGHGPVSVVVATDRWLYVGVDAPGGVRLFRAARAPSVAADFTGRDGCSAALPSCQGLGGDGLGVGATYLAGAARAEVNGVAWLWILAGDGAGPLRLLRVAD